MCWRALELRAVRKVMARSWATCRSVLPNRKSCRCGLVLPLRRGLGALGDLQAAGEQDTGYRKPPDEKRGGCREPRAVPCLNETRAADRPPRALSVPTARKTARRIAGGFVLVGLLKVKPTACVTRVWAGWIMPEMLQMFQGGKMPVKA